MAFFRREYLTSARTSQHSPLLLIRILVRTEHGTVPGPPGLQGQKGERGHAGAKGS